MFFWKYFFSFERKKMFCLRWREILSVNALVVLCVFVCLCLYASVMSVSYKTTHHFDLSLVFVILVELVK